MASSSPTRVSEGTRGQNGGTNPIRGCGDFANANADGVVNRVEDGGRSRDHRLLPDSLGAEGTDGRTLFNQYGFYRRHVARRGNQVVVQILPFAGRELFHERHAQSLCGAAFDLTLNQSGIDGPSDIMGGRNPEHAHGSEFDIHLHLGHVRAKTVYGIGIPLTILVERAGRRIERIFLRQDVPILIEREIPEVDRKNLAVVDCDHVSITKFERCAVTGTGHAQQSLAQGYPRHVCRLAGYECLTRRRGLPAIRRDGGISGKQIELVDGRAKRIGANLRTDEVRALTDIDRALVQSNPSVALQTDADSGRIRQGSVSASVPHAGDTDTSSQWGVGHAVEVFRFRASCVPAWAQRFKTFANVLKRCAHAGTPLARKRK